MTTTEQRAADREFREGAPVAPYRRPSKRKNGNPTPWAVLWLIENTDRGLVLVRGKNVRTVLDFAGLTNTARWSRSARGWVIDSKAVPDLAAACEYDGIPYRWRELKAGDA